MPIASYGVLKGKVVDKSKGTATDKTPHYEIHVKASAKNFRVAVNVQSKESPSEVLFLVDENLEPPHADQLKSLSGDFTPLGKKDEIAIDYVRSGLFDTSKMEALPANVPGKDNDLEDLVDKYVTLAMTKPGAMIYAFGSRFGPQKGKDKEFGFSPELGVHDIHMNQGNSDGFRKDDGVFQDGALLINLPQGDQWIAIFLAFQSQSFQTDDRNGHRLAAAAATPAHTPGSKPAKSAKHKPSAKQKASAKHKATAKKASAKHKKRKPKKHH